MRSPAFCVVMWASIVSGACVGSSEPQHAAGDDASHTRRQAQVPEQVPEQAAAAEHPNRSALASDQAAVIEQTRMGLLEYARLEPGMHIAEIGASRGWFVDRAGLALGPTGVVYATDIDPEAIAALREQAAQPNPARARVEVRVCTHERDTALSELPDAQLARVLMIDSLCFDGQFPRERDIAYLRELRRLLAPGGRLIHHMDCGCEAEPAAVIALFEAAGFTATAEQVDLPQPPEGDPAWTCATTAQRERHELVLSFTAGG